MKESRTRPVEKHKYSTYWKKANEFHDGMDKAEADEEWNLTALNAIHCAISSVDAVTTFYLKQHSAGQRHEDAATLLGQTGLQEAKERGKQLIDILSIKTLVEYEADEPTESEARSLAEKTRKLFKWASRHLPKAGT